MALRELDVQRAYHKGKDDIATDFYLPAIATARRYDRAVGYFSSSIFLLAWPSLKRFVSNGGRMRLICSPVLSEQDELAMRQGYSEQADLELGDTIKKQFAELLASPGLAKPVTVLASLVANGVIDCRVAWLSNAAEGRTSRIFHDKMGLLEDDAGDRVVFKGSMNETWPALSLDGNIESIDVFASWRDEGEKSRIRDEARYFEDLWEGRWPGVVVKPLPESARSEIISASRSADWPSLVDEICEELESAAQWSPEASQPGGRLPRPHQVAALNAWTDAGRRGILEHATGSGKTFTALCAMQAAFHLNEIPIVAVPSDLLLDQWEREIHTTFAASGVELLVCGGGNDGWRHSALLRSWTRPPSPGKPPRAVLTTMQTASGPQFIGLCASGDHLFLIGDEVHRLGAPEAQNVLTLQTGPRLGLSATPRRAGDPAGTAAIIGYFGGIVPPPFTLEDAIRSGTLTPYAYHPHSVELEPDEQDEWSRLTAQIKRTYARGHLAGSGWGDGAEARFKMLLIARARIAKGARRKTAKALEILQTAYSPGQRWIVYCDDQDQLNEVADTLRSAGVPDVYEYHSAMIGDAKATLNVFQRSGGIVVAIRCLDEGVDIPSVSHALILASSRNPREFIQRRGRVLRRHPGKLLAHIHDVLITPADADDGHGEFDSMLRGELLRAIEFGTNAVNPAAVSDLKRIAARMKIDWDELSAGFEVDETPAIETGEAVA
ncbi:DEAD/DEAH box helicase family protein [Devosia sp. LjRoot16]|uniref:DEAD/DEAH box helicase family protein n=1 Tax=Devosia sp. LjRoot16 TaxID=3342271 RepID=UPI003ED15547